MAKPTSVRDFFKQFPDDDACLKHLFDLRFGQGYKCPKCKREAKWYPIKAERAFSCQWCGHHNHPTVGTLFEASRTPLQLWFYAIFKFTATRQGVSGKELQRELGVTYKTAWRMTKMIREHMAEVYGEAQIGGAGTYVEIDETLVAGVKKGTPQSRQRCQDRSGRSAGARRRYHYEGRSEPAPRDAGAVREGQCPHRWRHPH